MIAGSQFGGPIGTYLDYLDSKHMLIYQFKAMIRDDKKVLLLQKQQPIKPTVYMYTSAGKLIEQIQVHCSDIITVACLKY